MEELKLKSSLTNYNTLKAPKYSLLLSVVFVLRLLNLDVNLPKLLPCGHSFCLFCLTLQETQTLPSICIDCPYCCIKYQHVPAAHFETNIDLIKVLERVQQSLQMGQQVPLQQNFQYVGQQQMLPYTQMTPPKKMFSQTFNNNNTPTRMNMHPVIGQQSQYDIRQVAQIFENMKLDVINNSPMPNKKNRSPIMNQQNASPLINRSPNQLPIQLCTRQGCRNPRLVTQGGFMTLHYCSKECDNLDQNKGAFTRNQDDLYRQARRDNYSRSKSPMRLNNFKSDGYSPIRGQGRSRSPIKSAFNNFKRQQMFSSDDSAAFDSDAYYTPQINRQNPNQNDPYAQQSDNMVRQLFDSSRRQNNQLQNTMGGFGESAFEKFIHSQHKEKSNFSSSTFDTPTTQAFSQYAHQPMPFQMNSGMRQPPPQTIHQQYQAQHSRTDSAMNDARLDITLAPNDPMKCIRPQCSNRKFLLNGQYLPVCSRKCAGSMNIAFNL